MVIVRYTNSFSCICTKNELETSRNLFLLLGETFSQDDDGGSDDDEEQREPEIGIHGGPLPLVASDFLRTVFQNGCDGPFPRPNNGQTAEDEAREQGDGLVVEFLENPREEIGKKHQRDDGA